MQSRRIWKLQQQQTRRVTAAAIAGTVNSSGGTCNQEAAMLIANEITKPAITATKRLVNTS